ncbi:14148_t:CDS:2, partial [Dentiscutata erythropus]
KKSDNHEINAPDWLGFVISLVQTVPISFSDNEYILTPPDLSHSSSLLLFSAPVVQGSYHPATNGGRESFMLSKHLYNGITNNKQVLSNIIVSYTNKNKHYNALKNNMQRTVLSVIERLKIGTSKIPHIIAFDIKWTYLGSEPQYSDQEICYAFPPPLQKKPKLSSFQMFGRKISNEKQAFVNFMDAISQVCTNKYNSEPTNVDPTPENREYITLSDIDIKIIPLSNLEEDANTISTDNIKSATPTSCNTSTF